MKIRYAPLAVACALMMAASAQAAAVTYSFGGTIDDVNSSPSFAIGDTFTGSFTYETTTADSNPDPGSGDYRAGLSISVLINGNSFSSSTAGSDCPACGGIEVLERNPTRGFVDVIYVQTQNVGGGALSPVVGPNVDGFAPNLIELGFIGPSTLYANDALPSSLDLSSFTEARINIGFRGENFSQRANGPITYLTLASTAPVPEASTSAMLALGLVALAFVRRRKSH